MAPLSEEIDMYFAMKNRLIMLVIFFALCGVAALIAPDMLAQEEAPQAVKALAGVCFAGWLFIRRLKVSDSS